MSMVSEHLQRLKDRLDNTYNLSNLSLWISKNTEYEGKALSYLGREYQPTVIDDPAKTLYVVKCAQLGLSEIFARWALASVVTQPSFTTIYTFPAATDAELFTKARLDPVIKTSKPIQQSLSKNVNSVELKQFGTSSFLYVRGTFSETGALSVPADLIIHDEYDRSDMNNVAAYVSRLQAKPTKMRRLFSTPTVARYGIDRECMASKRKKQVWTCNCCNHRFIPNYHDNVHIPGYSDDKKLLNKLNLKDVRWREAVILCPKCGRVPDSGISHREWVIENQMEHYDAVSYFISPFSAPSFITAPYLVEASTKFAKWSEFKNQALGETAEESDESIIDSDIRALHSESSLDSSELHCIGVDLGVICHVVIGRLVMEASGFETLLVVHRERVHYTKLEERRLELAAKYSGLMSVHDLFPYSDIITRIVDMDPRAFGAIYTEMRSTELYTIKEQAENPDEGRLNVRSVMINRNVAFDSLMGLIKQKRVVIHGVDDELVTHMTDMKRIQKIDKFNTMRYVWEKTTGVDHYHHAMLYMYIATQMRGLAGAWTTPGAVPLVFRFRQKNV
jgi:hypothetical protein